MLSRTEWKLAWERHLVRYASAPPRTGVFVRERLGRAESVLEIGCGSGRDSVYLAQHGSKVTAVDYEGGVVANLKSRLEGVKVFCSAADAFALPFRDKQFELVFHNGLFVCFRDDDDIRRLLFEQARVAKKRICAFVHNGENQRLVRRFEARGKTDPFYDIRFFRRDELINLVERSGLRLRRVRLLKFGGPVDALYNRSFKDIAPNVLYPWRERLIPKLYELQPWRSVERVVAVIDLG